MKAKELDLQNQVEIDRWVDYDSPEFKKIDQYPYFTKQCLQYGFEAEFMIIDDKARVWGRGADGRYFPFHLEDGKKKVGVRLPGKAPS